MRHGAQVARWLHAQMVHAYRNAAPDVPFRIDLLTIRSNSGLLQYDMRNAAFRMKKALTELCEAGILERFQDRPERGPKNRLINVVYILWPTAAYTKTVVAANVQARQAVAALDKPGARTVVRSPSGHALPSPRDERKKNQTKP